MSLTTTVKQPIDTSLRSHKCSGKGAWIGFQGSSLKLQKCTLRLKMSTRTCSSFDNSYIKRALQIRSHETAWICEVIRYWD